MPVLKGHDFRVTSGTLPETDAELPQEGVSNPEFDTSNSSFGKIETTTVMGWEYLQDLAELWMGTRLIDNSTFPQQSNWPTFVVDDKDPNPFERSTVTTLINLDVSNPIKPKGEIEIFSEDHIKDVNFGNQTYPDGPPVLSLSGYRGGGVSGGERLPSYNYNFNATLNNWMIEQTTYDNVMGRIQFPEGRKLDPSHWYAIKYNKNNTFAFFASLPDSLDPFIIKEDGTSPYSVCSIPDFLDYEISGTRRSFNDIMDMTKSLKIDQKIKFNAVILYADNDGTPALICATKLDPTIESQGIAPNFFQYRYYSQSIETSNIKIEEL